jgi:cyclic-di-GMP phosphodiesterase TipF (flagellum assembly factor)
MNALFTLGYAAGAAGLALTLPQVSPLAPAEAGAVGMTVFLAASLLHEAVRRRTTERELTETLGQMRRIATEQAAELDGARREMLRLRAAVVAGETRHEEEIAQLRPLLGELAARFTRKPSLLPPLDPRTLPEPELTRSEEELMAIVRHALEENKVELWLQPVVTLPQRKIRFYETFSRLRADDGTLVAPEHYLPLAEAAGLAAIIDNMLLFRCVHLIRSIVFFVNISAASLADEAFFEQFVEFLGNETELPEQLVFEIAASALLAAEPAVQERLDRLAALGFRFSADKVKSLALDVPALTARHVRWIKIGAEILLSPDRQAEAPLVIGDLKTALRRNGIDLIATRVEGEAEVRELLDIPVDYGQGYLFGEPRAAKEG